MKPIEKFLAKLPDARPSGKGWTARCPAHEDRQPSLSVTEGEDGRVLIWCHAGCETEAIVETMGLQMKDLMPAGSVDVDKTPYRPGKKKVVSTEGRLAKTYPFAREAVAELERRHGKWSSFWTYYDANGEPVGVVVRWDRPDGKKIIRPVSRRKEGWALGGMPEPRPLYRLPDLAGAKRVYVCEGEKAAEAAWSIGLIATTSPHGAKSAAKADWSPLAGKEVMILPDNDNAGKDYAKTIRESLSKLTPAPVVRVVTLPDLPKGGDIVDWTEAHGDAAEPADLRQQVEAMADQAEVVELARPEPLILPWRSFPVDVLPEPIRRFVVVAAEAIGCDESFLALPLLSALAAAIGNTRRIQLKGGWTEPTIIWTAIAAESGSMKSPALETALHAVRERQRRAFADYEEQMADYREDCMQYEKDLAEWRRSKDRGGSPPKPEESYPERYWCDDSTTEALAVLLSQQPRGLLMVRDELAGWIGGFDRYGQGKGGDVARWLEMFGGRNIVIDRKTGDRKTLRVERAAVSVTGGIQPGVLRRVLIQQYRDNGLAARLLVVCPPQRSKHWTEAEIDPELQTEVTKTFNGLYDLEPAIGDDGKPQPVIVGLTPEGKRLWIEFYNKHADEHKGLTGDLAAVWSKLEGYTARFALVIHHVRLVAGDPTLTSPTAVDEGSIAAAVRLSQWFGHEARRVYGMLAESEDDRDRRQLVEVIRRKGGSITARELMRSSRQYRTADDAENALDDLVKAGMGRWQDSTATDRGGRPTRQFVLAAAGVDETPSISQESQGSVNVNASSEGSTTPRGDDEPAIDESDDWGVI